jgi:hypothetical protein
MRASLARAAQPPVIRAVDKLATFVSRKRLTARSARSWAVKIAFQHEGFGDRAVDLTTAIERMFRTAPRRSMIPGSSRPSHGWLMTPMAGALA